MKKIIFILPIFITCNVSQNEKSKYLSDSNKNNKYAKMTLKYNITEANPNTTDSYQYKPAALKISEGTLNVCLQPHFHWFHISNESCKITWAKTNVQKIIGPDTKPLKELQGKLKYSYAIAPIKNNENYSKYVMPLILFESLVDYIQVTSLKLTSNKDLDLDFHKGDYQHLRNSIVKQVKQAIQDLGYKSVHIYGTLHASKPNGGEELISACANHYNNNIWSFMEAEITIYDKLTRQTTTHTILLDSQLFNEFLKIIITNHPRTTNANDKFRVPIYE
ncbi:S2/P23 family protein (plasmid) [Borrelia anserina]|uniref:p23-like cell envelope protein n=2 Tax=Borrelia anserina TaxID=143 RepID=W5SQ34_BORAN|nr:S2/P23 family protein [Borrelia anserina]AHH08987.1 P23-like cell envelope protein [Borrelia anserina BA2]APR65349.1 P23 like cell envelope protein [Borrelia anserina Es]UPA07315.1 S2/P23 family protein [Borrelia anserina]